MKKDSEFRRLQNHSILLPEQLRRIWTDLREAESCVEHEMALRDLERIVQRMERFGEGEGA